MLSPFRSAALLAATLLAPVAAQADPLDLPAGFDSLVVVRDVLPALQAALASEVLNAPLVADQLAAGGVRLDALRAGLAVFARHVPVEVVIGTPPQSLAVGAHMWGAVAALIVLGTDPEAAEAKARLKTHFGALGDLAIAGRARARDLDTARFWFDALTDALDELPEAPGLAVAVEGDTIELGFEPLRFRQGQALQRFGLPASLAADLPLRWTVRIQRVDATLTFRVGKAAPGALDPAVLGPLWRNAAEQLFFGRLNATVAQEVMDGVREFIEEHEAELDAAVERDAVFGRILDLLASQEEWTDPTTTCALNLIDGGMELLDNTDFGEGAEVEPLRQGGVVGYIDPAFSMFGAVNLDADLVFHLVLEMLSEQVERRAARDRLAGRETGATRLDAFCGDQLLPLREFFGGDESECFAGGTLLVLESGSEVTSITASGPGGDAKASLEGVRLPAFAWIGELAADSEPFGFARACTGSALAMLGAAGTAVQLAEADLGLGVPTRVVPWSAIVRGGSSLALGGDVQPHWFVHAGSLGFSTSPALSRRLLARHAASQLVPPAGVMGWWRYGGAASADAIDQVGAALATFAAPAQASVRTALGVDLTPAAAGTLQEACRLAAALVRRIDRIEMRQRIDGRRYDDRITVMWARR